MDNLLYIQFDHYLLMEKPEVLSQLANFYCSIWMYDPNFGEYKQCPVCKKYYSEHQVETLGISTCSGTPDKPHALVQLVEAWNPDEVAAEILELSSMGPRFFGALAIDGNLNKIVGFTWGWLRSLEDVAESWGQEVVNGIHSTTGNVTYYSEFATDPSYRNRGIGSTLCKMLTGWMKANHPDIPGLLRTHKDSPARRIFEKVGYRVFTEDTMYGGGRVMLMVDLCKNLKPEIL